MIVIRRLLLLLGSVLIGMVLFLAGMVAFLDDTGYKRSAVWIADHFLDTRLVIGGALTLRLAQGRDLVLTVNDVALDAGDDSYHFSGKSVQASIRLRPLLSGTLWLNDLEVDQLFLKLNESDTSEAGQDAPGLLPFILARANIQDMVVEYQELPPGTLHHFSLNQLQLIDAADSRPISIQANGVFEDQAFKISGTLPPIDEVLDQVTPKPVELLVKSKHGQLHIAGAITDLMNGKGLDLRLNMATSDTKLLLEWFGDGIPDVGDLLVTATVRGDYEAPRIEEIDAHLQRGAAVDISVRGAVTDVYSGEGLLLHVNGHSKDPEVASWLLFNKLGQISALKFSGSLQEQDGTVFISGLDATATTPRGLSVSMLGTAAIYDGEHLFLKSDSGFSITFTAPTTAAANLFDRAGIPELGPVSGRFKLLISTDALGVSDADVSLGNTGALTARLQGQIRDIQLDGEATATGIGLQLSIQSPDVAALADTFGYTLPAIGSGKATMEVIGGLDALKLKRVDIRTVSRDGLQLAATGNVDRLVPGRPVTLDSVLFDITAKTTDLSKLSRLAGTELPKLGPASMSSTMTLLKSDLVFDDLKVNIGRPDQPTIRLQGKMTTQLHKGSSIQLSYNVAVADLVAAYTDRIPDYLGRFQGVADISDMDGSWGIEKFNLASSQTRLYQVDIHGGIDDLKNSDLANISVDFELKDPAGLGKALGIDLSWMKSYREQGQLDSQQDALVYNGKLLIGSKSSGTTAVRGYMRGDKPYFSGRISIPRLDLADFGFRVEQDTASEIIARPDSSGSDFLFSRKPMQVGFFNSFDLDLGVDIDEVESYGKSSIDSVIGHVTLQNGDFRIDPLRFVYAGGTMDVSFGLQAREPPVYSLKVFADDLVLGPMMAQVSKNTPIDGRTNVHLDVTANGDSAHELVSSLSGDINVELENVRIPSVYVDFLSLNVFGWVLSETSAGRKYVNLNCVLTDFTANAGELTSKLLVADGPDLSIGGRIDMNLRDETIDAVLLPKQKGRLFSNITPVKLSGPMKDPKVQAIPTQAAIKEIGTLALSPTIYLSALLLDRVWSSIRSGGTGGEGCTNVEKMTDEAEKAAKATPAGQNPVNHYLLSD